MVTRFMCAVTSEILFPVEKPKLNQKSSREFNLLHAILKAHVSTFIGYILCFRLLVSHPCLLTEQHQDRILQSVVQRPRPSQRRPAVTTTINLSLNNQRKSRPPSLLPLLLLHNRNLLVSKIILNQRISWLILWNELSFSFLRNLKVTNFILNSKFPKIKKLSFIRIFLSFHFELTSNNQSINDNLHVYVYHSKNCDCCHSGICQHLTM